MNGITEDHQFKTKQGWKYFHEIEIKKDDLYCWKFENSETKPGARIQDKIYFERKIVGNKYVREPPPTLVKPIKNILL